jgi:hypothetical protein
MSPTNLDNLVYYFMFIYRQYRRVFDRCCVREPSAGQSVTPRSPPHTAISHHRHDNKPSSFPLLIHHETGVNGTEPFLSYSLSSWLIVGFSGLEGPDARVFALLPLCFIVAVRSCCLFPTYILYCVER